MRRLASTLLLVGFLSSCGSAENADINSAMQSVAKERAMACLQMGAGKLPIDLRYDIAPVINGHSEPDGLVDTGDAIVWLSIADGKIKWSDLGLTER